MEKIKTSKKVLLPLINNAMHDALLKLELPAPSKKIEKLLKRNAKKLAIIYAHKIKRDLKKASKEKVAASVDKAKKKGKKLKAEVSPSSNGKNN